jgi:hypothetical protein
MIDVRRSPQERIDRYKKQLAESQEFQNNINTFMALPAGVRFAIYRGEESLIESIERLESLKEEVEESGHRN